MSTIPAFGPLPVPTRCVGGESIDSYAARHAQRNASTVEYIERAVQQQGYPLRAVQQQGYPLRKARLAPQRLALWRQLGGLHSSAFSTPTSLAGAWVSSRWLCQRCAGGDWAYGRLPRTGNVCLRHHRWIGIGEQIDLSNYPAALTAERGFRTHLASRQVMFDSSAMLVGLLAATGALSPAELDRRKEISGIDRPEVLAYPEQVRLARLLALPSLMRIATDPTQPGEVRRALVERAVRQVVASGEENKAWHAQTRVWQVVAHLTEARRTAAPSGEAPDDSLYGLLRLWC